MDIEFTQENQIWQMVFQPITQFPTSTLYQQQITLENTFGTLPHLPSPNILLTLVDNTILLSNPIQYQVQPFAAVKFNFDLKFQVINLGGLHGQNNVTSTKIGIKLFYDNEKEFSFYSNNPNIIESWSGLLAKKLNQKGFHEMFKPLRKLGKGNFATVYEVERVTDGSKFAVKAFSKSHAFSAKNGKQGLINQLNIMRQLSLQHHPNLLKLQSVYESDNSIYVVLQLLNGGQLYHRIQQWNGNFASEEVKQFMTGLLSGMATMHQKRIMHRDLKPQNIMLRSNTSMSPVIVDFGLATLADQDKYIFFRCGTPGYVAPEIIELNQSRHIEPECDVFSAGVIFHILLTRKTLFQGSKYEQVYRKNKEMNFILEGDLYSNMDSYALDLLKKMLISDPKYRITASKALQHSYFDKNLRSTVEVGKMNSPCLTSASKSLAKTVSNKLQN